MSVHLNTKDKENALSWLHDLFIIGGIKDENTAKRDKYHRFSNNAYYAKQTAVINACKEICDEILNRQFKDLDNEFKTLSDVAFYSKFGPGRSAGRPIRRSAEHLAAYVAWFCANNGIYWDNSLKTTYERDLFEQTLLGAAIKNYDGFVEPKAISNSTKTSSTRTNTPRVKGQPPKNDYKSTGGQSANVRDLKGTPGSKEILQGPVLFVIKGVNANTAKVPYAFIRPLKASGASGTTNKVFIGDPSGYTDCTLFFTSHQDADTFLIECVNKATIPSNISNLQVAKIAVDKNGYYRVGTEFGEAYIKASKLNEALTDVNEELNETHKQSYVEDSIEFEKNLMKE